MKPRDWVLVAMLLVTASRNASAGAARRVSDPVSVDRPVYGRALGYAWDSPSGEEFGRCDLANGDQNALAA
jgi:hypothetical protein